MKPTTLTELGVLYGTDKATTHHYTEEYDKLFLPFKDKPTTIMEIGIFEGASIRMWRDYFQHPEARIIGLDIQGVEADMDPRVTMLIQDARDYHGLDWLGEKYRPDIVIDDGSHEASDIIIAFAALWPYVRHNGIYVIEDLHGSHISKKFFRKMRLDDGVTQLMHGSNLLVCTKKIAND